MNDKTSVKEIVTPSGGPRPREAPHSVGLEEVVGQTPPQSKEFPRSGSVSVLDASTDVLITPGGARLKSQVHEIEAGHFLDGSDGRQRLIHRQSGAVIRDFGPTPRRPGDVPLMPGNVSLPRTATTAPPGLGTGWITFASWENNTGKPISLLKSSWVVPPFPANQSGQLIYLFNGIQNDTMIYQPVLQWGDNGLFGGNFWVIACWYADGQNGMAFHSTPVPVVPGTKLVGTMTLTGQSGSLFNYECNFLGFPDNGLPIANQQELKWCVETLEAYKLTQSSDYPQGGETSFTAIEIKVGGFEAPVAWIPETLVSDSGQRTIVVSDASPGGEVDLFYGHWDKGFTWFTSVDLPGTSYVWAYRFLDGVVCIHHLNAGGLGFTQKFRQPWSIGFSAMVGFSLAGTPYVWAYRASDGTVCIHQINFDGNGFTQKWDKVWSAGFTGFTAVSDSSGNVYIWAYNPSNGTVCIHQINAKGAGFTQKFQYTWDTGFSAFEGFSLAGVPYVWAYRASDGTVCIHQIDAFGQGFTQKWDKVWSAGFTGFSTGQLAGHSLIWAYHPNGTVCIHQINANGAGFTQTWDKMWSTGFTGFAACNLTPDSLIWAYDLSSGTVCIHKINANGAGFTQVFID